VVRWQPAVEAAPGMVSRYVRVGLEASAYQKLTVDKLDPVT